MGTISTGIGLISGIDTATLINQLLAIEARPLQRAQERVATLQFQQTAFMDINARLLALSSSASAFNTSNIFQSAKATSSNSDILTATANSNAALGTYNFTVNRLVSTHQEISRGYADKDASAVGATDFSFEIGGGSLQVDTDLTVLNGGNGIDRGKIEIEDSQGNSAIIDLSTATTVDEVIQAINANGNIEVTASVDDDHFVITDDNGGTVTVSDVYGSQTATSLGIAGSATGAITGTGVYYLSENTGLSTLNDGTGVLIQDGVEGATFDLQITVGGVSHQISLGELQGSGDDDGKVQARSATLGDVIDHINDAFSGVLTASISADGKSLELTAANAGDDITVAEVGTGTTARDLGILGTATGTLTGDSLIGSMDSTMIDSLNGGSGLAGASALTITDRAGNSFAGDLDVSSYVSVSQLINAINDKAQADGVSIVASLNETGNGIKITDTSGGSNNLQISGDAADALNLTADVASDSVDTGNLQQQYIAEATLLSSLNAGQGIGTGSFVITDAYGVSSTITVDDSLRTVDDLVDLINSRGIHVAARINDNGDGIIVEATDDGTPGTQSIKIEDSSGTVAKSLNLVGEAASSDDNYIDGSFERHVTFDSADSLQDIADKINAANVGVQAVIVNDGTGAAPYHLSLVSDFSGTAGKMSIDTGGLDLGLSTLTEAQDAIVFFGSSDPAEAVLLKSSSNTLDNAIQGVTIDLNGTSSSPVELTISRDTSSIEGAVDSFVSAFNDVLDRLDNYDSYNSDTEERGILLGDSTVARLRSALYSTIQEEPDGVDSQYNHLYEVGVSIGSGGKLEFDRDKFRAALEADPEGVADLFGAREVDTSTEEEIVDGVTTPVFEQTFTALGVAEKVRELADSFTDSLDGVLTQKNESIDGLIKIQKDNIDAINAKLDYKRGVLERQFAAMEQALAALQSQQNSLGMITSIG